MKFFRMLAAAMLVAFTVPAAAQSTRASLTLVNNSYFYGCGNGCITGTMVNSFNAQSIASLAFLSDANTFTAVNTYLAGTLYFPGQVGYVYSNGTQPATFSSSATGPIAANSIVGNNTGGVNGPYALTPTQIVAMLPGSALAAALPANSLTNSQLAQANANSIKCNPTGSAANVQDCTGVQVASILPVLSSNLDNLFINPQWQILDNSLTVSPQIGPQSVSVLPTFTVTGSNTGSAEITFNVTGSPNINVNDLVQLTGGGINVALSGKTMRVTAVTASPVTAFTAQGPLAAYSPGISQSGTGQVVNLEDIGISVPASGQYWSKATTLQFWPTSYPTDLDPGALRCLGIYMGGVAGTTGGAATQSMAQPLSADLVSRLRGQTVTVSFRVQQRVKGGSGTSQAYLSINGTLYFGTPTAGGGSYEDVRMTYTIPTNATTIAAGINFSGASTDAYYVCKPHLAMAPALPANYFSEVPNDFLQSNMDIVPYSLNGATIQFPSSTDPTGVYYSLYHDHFAETNGRVHWTVTCIQFTTEAKIASPGAALGWRNILGNPGGNQIVYGTPTYPPVAGITGTAQNRLPTDRGGQTNSIAPGFLIIYSATSAANFTAVSMDVQGYCLN